MIKMPAPGTVIDIDSHHDVVCEMGDAYAERPVKLDCSHCLGWGRNLVDNDQLTKAAAMKSTRLVKTVCYQCFGRGVEAFPPWELGIWEFQGR